MAITRDKRWDFRVAESEDDLVKAASECAETSITSFVRTAAVSEARRVLVDRRYFRLEESEWTRLNEMLDRPAKVPPGLAELFAKPSVFE